MTENKLNCVVVGGFGYIGSELSSALYSSGNETTVIDRNIFLSDHGQYNKLVLKDIRDVTVDDFEGADWVFDYSGLSNDPTGDLDVSLTSEVNITGRHHCATTAKKAGVANYVFASTCSVYGSVPSGIDVDENFGVTPLTAYAQSATRMEEKLAGIADENFRVLCIRHGTVYGLSQKMRFDLVVNLMCKTAFTEKSLYVTGGGDQRRPLVSISTIVEFCEHLLDLKVLTSQFGTVNLAEANFQIKQLAQAVSKVWDDVSVTIVPDDADKRDYSISTSKLQEEFNFLPANRLESSILELRTEFPSLNIYDPRYYTQPWYKLLLQIDKNRSAAGRGLSD